MSQTHNSNGNLLWREKIILQENWAEWQYEHFPNVLSEKIILHQFAMIMVIVSGHIFINREYFYSKCNRFTKFPVMGKVCVWIHKHPLLNTRSIFQTNHYQNKKLARVHLPISKLYYLTTASVLSNHNPQHHLQVNDRCWKIWCLFTCAWSGIERKIPLYAKG